MEGQHATRWVFAALSLVCALVAAAPALVAAAHPFAASFLYMLFAPVCRQAAGRSFDWLGFPLALCARCTGIVAGAWLAALAARFASPLKPLRWPVLIAAALLMMDVGTELAGLRPPLAWLRLLTGLGLGSFGGAWLVAGVKRLEEEWKHDSAAPWRAQSTAI